MTEAKRSSQCIPNEGVSSAWGSWNLGERLIESESSCTIMINLKVKNETFPFIFTIWTASWYQIFLDEYTTVCGEDPLIIFYWIVQCQTKQLFISSWFPLKCDLPLRGPTSFLVTEWVHVMWVCVQICVLLPFSVFCVRLKTGSGGTRSWAPHLISRINVSGRQVIEVWRLKINPILNPIV